jgi:hypothetical protein
MSEIRPEYDYHQPDPDQLARMTRLREAFSQLQDVLDANAPQSRYRSLATTTLETAAFWANKAVILG